MANIFMTRAQYDALLSAAQIGNLAAATILQRDIDKANSITRYILNVRWQDIGGQPPPRIELGKGWPVEMTYKIVMERPISRADVDIVLQTNTSNPVSVMVTPDPNGIVGWHNLEDYSF